MSKITTLYDALVTRIETLLPSHKRLSDPYRFLKNTDSEKRQGYGLRISDGENTRQQLSCDIILRQNFTIVLTRLVAGRETEHSKKAATEKQVLEDLFTLVGDFEADPTLGIPATIISADYINHGGINFMESERDDHIMIEANFEFRYREDLN